MQTGYRGRFAPSPTGPLHAGSVVAALASWLDARAHHGTWLIRIEDVDAPRSVAGMDRVILQQLAALGLHPNEPPVYQSARRERYVQALEQLKSNDFAYACQCSRKDIEAALRAQGLLPERGRELVYPGTCRLRRLTASSLAWRLRIDLIGLKQSVDWQDRRLGAQHQAVDVEVGDFSLLRTDSCFTYQLAVVVDDAAQGITHVVRGEDLADNTARQILLQRALGLATPHYLHTPLVLGANGEKLSKQNGAAALDVSRPLATLSEAASVLGLSTDSITSNGQNVSEALAHWVAQWHELYNCHCESPKSSCERSALS